MEYLSPNMNPEVLDESNLTGPIETQFNPDLQTAGELYQTGGYWLANSQIMDLFFHNDVVADVAFDHLEELVWCITKAVSYFI